MGRTYRKRKQGRQSKTSHPDTSAEHDGELSAFCVKNGCKGVKSLRPYTFHGKCWLISQLTYNGTHPRSTLNLVNILWVLIKYRAAERHLFRYC